MMSLKVPPARPLSAADGAPPKSCWRERERDS
jgi:hypothetical protein